MSSEIELDTQERIRKLVQSLLSRISRRYSLSYADQQDLAQAASLAALEALPRYIAATGTLEAFLAERVGYAMVDELEQLRNGGITGDYGKEVSVASADYIPEYTGAISRVDDGDATSNINNPILESIPDESLPDPVERVFTEQVLELVRRLPPLQARILVRYYGLFGCVPHTQRELASHYRTNLTDINRRLSAAMESLKLLAGASS